MHTTGKHYANTDGDLIIGDWTSVPGKFLVATSRDEFCQIINGHCDLVSDTGIIGTFRAGDSFVIPCGFAGHWNIIETTTKYFVI